MPVTACRQRDVARTSIMTFSPSRYRHCVRMLATLLLAAATAGCSSVIDVLPPAVGGLPEGTPERPANPPAFPSVHDMPPARGDTPLNEAEKKRLQEELIASRERAARQGAGTESAATGTTPPGGAGTR